MLQSYIRFLKFNKLKKKLLTIYSSRSSIITDLSNEYTAELDLTRESALKKLLELKNNVEESVSHLLTFVHESWRKVDNVNSLNNKNINES